MFTRINVTETQLNQKRICQYNKTSGRCNFVLDKYQWSGWPHELCITLTLNCQGHKLWWHSHCVDTVWRELSIGENGEFPPACVTCFPKFVPHDNRYSMYCITQDDTAKNHCCKSLTPEKNLTRKNSVIIIIKIIIVVRAKNRLLLLSWEMLNRWKYERTSGPWVGVGSLTFVSVKMKLANSKINCVSAFPGNVPSKTRRLQKNSNHVMTAYIIKNSKTLLKPFSWHFNSQNCMAVARLLEQDSLMKHHTPEYSKPENYWVHSVLNYLPP